MLCSFQVYNKVIQLYIHMYFFFQIFFPCRLLQNIEYTSLYYTVGPFWLSILDTVVCVYVNPKHLIYPPSSLITISLFSMSVGLFLFCI